MNIEKIIQIFCNGEKEEKVIGFLKFLFKRLWKEFNDYLRDERLIIENKVKALPLTIPNASVNKEYDYKLEIPDNNMTDLELTGLTVEEHGLTITKCDDGRSFRISGTPTIATTDVPLNLTLRYKYKDKILDRDFMERKLTIIINPDPRSLWKSIPVSEGTEYPKQDRICAYIKVEALRDGTPQKDIVVASVRGRSHANEGKPRDDDYMVKHLDNDWYIMAVADGAGSAKFSRGGSMIACKEAVNHCIVGLSNSKNFEAVIRDYNQTKDDKDKKRVGDNIYNILGMAAFKAHKAIETEAKIKGRPIKDYATTLLLTICNKFDFGWFIASFWVGDGAICLYERKKHTAKILGVPDEGEYAGQTRFLTMSDIFKDSTSLYNRLRFNIVDDFTALFLMTDGVSDPKFETDANLMNPDKWDELWDDLKQNGVELTDDNEKSQYQLLNWLDFWKPGHHDDRTIAILYEGEKVPENEGEKNAGDEVENILDSEKQQPETDDKTTETNADGEVEGETSAPDTESKVESVKE